MKEVLHEGFLTRAMRSVAAMGEFFRLHAGGIQQEMRQLVLLVSIEKGGCGEYKMVIPR
jgi:hypothetical protein